MKILHTSDWHLGISVHGISMLDEQLNFKKELLEIIDKHCIDAVILSGDVFDSSVSCADAIRLFNDIATEICLDKKIPFIVIAGNHDGAARLSSMNELLKKSGMYVCGKLKRNIEPVNIENAAIYQIPYFNIDEVRAYFPDEEIKNYEEATRIICNNIVNAMDKSKFNIAVAHSFVSGAVTSESDHSAVIGTATQVSKDVFDGFDYVALGHLHKPQNVSDNVRYSGTPVKYSFSEANVSKSVTIIDTDTGEFSTVPLVPIHDMRIVNGTLNEISLSEHSEDYIKAEITDKYPGLEVIDTLSDIFPNMMLVTGKNISSSDTTSMSISEIENISPLDLIDDFFADIFGETPNKEHKRAFEDALLKAEKGGELE